MQPHHRAVLVGGDVWRSPILLSKTVSNARAGQPCLWWAESGKAPGIEIPVNHPRVHNFLSKDFPLVPNLSLPSQNHGDAPRYST